MKGLTGNIHPAIKDKVDKMVARGVYDGKFGHLPHANYMVAKVHEHGVTAKVHEKLGHAQTIDTAPSVRLEKHFHVEALHGTAHRILGKFV